MATHRRNRIVMKFLHAADLHLDSPLEGLENYEGAPVDLIRSASRRALENLVQLAIQERVDFVVIAGDLYNGDWRDFNTGLFFVRQMNKLCDAGIRHYLIAGNHDAASVMTRKLRLPVNPDGFSVMLSSDHPETRRLEDLGVAIHGRSFAHQIIPRRSVRGSISACYIRVSAVPKITTRTHRVHSSISVPKATTIGHSGTSTNAHCFPLTVHLWLRRRRSIPGISKGGTFANVVREVACW